MHETQEIKRSRPVFTRQRCVAGGKPPEAQQASFIGVQLESEFRQSLVELRLEPLGVRFMLKAEHYVVGVAHDENIAACIPSPDRSSAGLASPARPVQPCRRRSQHAPRLRTVRDTDGVVPRRTPPSISL